MNWQTSSQWAAFCLTVTSEIALVGFAWWSLSRLAITKQFLAWIGMV